MNSNLSKLVKRTSELDVIKRFLENPVGGILLVGGDRGSGKTTLVQTAIKETDSIKPKRLLSRIRGFTRSKLIIVSIPLIIIGEKQSNTSDRDIREQYRSLLMRAMVLGLEADLLKRYSKYYAWLDLPLRWFRSIGYVQRLQTLKPYSHYISLSKTTTKALSAPASILSTPAAQSALSAEFDLSDSNLEMKLRDLLTQYSGIHKFIFTFDELDKLPESIQLESLVLYLKNLFAETGVYGIFVTDEKNLKRIISRSNTYPPTEVSTLFVSHLLLNNLSGVEFEEVVKQSVTNADNTRDMPQLVAALSLLTHRSPYSLSKVMLKYGTDYNSLIIGMRSDLGTTVYNRFGVMQRYKDYVNNLYSEYYTDPYYKRTLSSTLDDLGAILLNNSTHYLSFEDPLSVLFTSNLFPGTDVEQAEDEEKEETDNELEAKKLSLEGYESRPEIIEQIETLSDDQQKAVVKAVECLVTLLNRAEHLPINHVDGVVFALGNISGRTFIHDQVDPTQFESILNLSDTEIKIVKKLETYNPAYYSIKSSNIYGLAQPVRLDEVNDPLSSGKYSISNSRPQWALLKSSATSSQKTLFSVFFGRVNSHASTEYTKFTHHRANSAYVALNNGSRYQVIMVYGSQQIKIRGDVVKTFIIRDTSSRAKNQKQNTKVKNFRATSNWSNIDKIARDIARWVDAQV